jgi:[acyl-carrier-protein] S-malonyltransferase
MGSDIYASKSSGKKIFKLADEILGFPLSEIMFEGTSEDLKQTKVTQPALFVHSMAKIATLGDDFKPSAVAGHSLGEFSALAAAGALDFESALLLVHERAMAMQYACDIEDGTMAAILGLEDQLVEKVCQGIEEEVVPANYNCPGQLVISGSVEGINKAVEQLKELGARRALVLPVGGAFHSPLMAPAEDRLANAINETEFSTPICPVYQNIDALPHTSSLDIKSNLLKQLTGPVRWTQTIQKMAADGITEYAECGGSGKVLMGLIRKINKDLNVESI